MANPDSAAQIAFHRLGLTLEDLQSLIDGKSVAFTFPNAAEGITGIARILSSNRLQIGIYIINNPGGGLIDFLAFDARARAAARAIGAAELELIGVEITNPGLRAVLERSGFMPTVVDVPEELGGGTANALARIDPVD